MLERMYLRWASAQGFSTHVTDRSAGAHALPPVFFCQKKWQYTAIRPADGKDGQIFGFRTASENHGVASMQAHHPVAQMLRHSCE